MTELTPNAMPASRDKLATKRRYLEIMKKAEEAHLLASETPRILADLMKLVSDPAKPAMLHEGLGRDLLRKLVLLEHLSAEVFVGCMDALP